MTMSAGLMMGASVAAVVRGGVRPRDGTAPRRVFGPCGAGAGVGGGSDVRGRAVRVDARLPGVVVSLGPGACVCAGAGASAGSAAGGRGSAKGLGRVCVAGAAVGEGGSSEGVSAEEAEIGRRLVLASEKMRKWGWAGFWAQLTLSLVSGVSVAFASAFLAAEGSSGGAMAGGVALALGSLALALLSTAWTFGYVRLGKRLAASAQSDVTKAPQKKSLLGRLKTGVVFNVVGMLLVAVSGQITVGLLLAKSMTAGFSFGFGARMQQLPVTSLDMLVLQAINNLLLSHLVGLIANLWLVVRISAVGKQAAPKGGPSFA